MNLRRLALIAALAWLGACARQSVEVVPAVEIPFETDLLAAERLAEALKIRTISADLPGAKDEFLKLHELLETKFVRVHEAMPPVKVKELSLLYTWPGRDPSLKPILLIAHMDVVPANGDNWENGKGPFSGAIDAEGMIWGRGSLDDKLSVLGLLEAVDYLLGKKFSPERTIYLGFGHDEELDGEGAQAIAARLQEELAGRKLEFVLDEGLVIGVGGLVPGVDKPVALIGLAEKGYLSLRLTVEGTGGHSSTPPEEGAIVKLARAIDRLKRSPLPAEIRSPVAEMLDAVAPEMSFVRRTAMTNRWLFGGLVTSQLAGDHTSNAMVRTTTAPTMIKSGDKDNVLPQEAYAIVNFRILPGDSVASVTRYVREVIDDPSIAVEDCNDRPVPKCGAANEPSAVSDANSDSFEILRQTVQEIFPGTVVAPALVIAATDSRHYGEIADNTYRFLPVPLTSKRLEGIHGTDERLESAHYAALIHFYIQLIRNAAGSAATVNGPSNEACAWR